MHPTAITQQMDTGYDSGGGGVLRKYLYRDAQSRLQNVDHLYTCVLQKKKKNTWSLYLTCD